ncbi:hypothetical protein [Parasitella parasitica]|uniref:Uncharacterized protein n=1 Tax=Parasitella parasitica TaxID=35722 RepID=A0A0B7NJA5_9FUNG|nr:hypothetical protein [Parasitella parasitica]
MNIQENQIIKEIRYWCLIYVSNDQLQISMFSENDRNSLRSVIPHLMYLDLLKSINHPDIKIRTTFKKFHDFLDDKNFNEIQKNALQTSLKENDFYSLANESQVVLLSDIEAAALFIARHQKENIAIVSLSSNQMVETIASKQQVEIVTHKELGINTLSDMKDEFITTVSESVKNIQIEYDSEWKHLKKQSSEISLNDKWYFRSINDDFTVTFSWEKTEKIARHINIALDKVKINANGQKLVFIDDLGYFDTYFKKQVSDMSLITPDQREESLKKVKDAQKGLQDAKKVEYDCHRKHQASRLVEDSNCEALRQKLEEATRAVEDAACNVNQAVSEERDTWLKTSALVGADDLMKGAMEGCKPISTDVPIYKFGLKTGIKKISVPDKNYTTLVVIDFGTAYTKVKVYNLVEVEWMQKLERSFLTVAVYDDKEKELIDFDKNAMMRYLNPQNESDGHLRLLKSFKLMLETITNDSDIDNIRAKIAGYLGMIYKSIELDPTSCDVRFCFSYPSVWSQRAIQVMRQSISDSGIPFAASKVMMIPEAEAVALSCVDLIQDIEHKEKLSKNDDIIALICDVGGGTADMSMYKFPKKNCGSKITQISGHDGALCGSHVLDNLFREVAKEKCRAVIATTDHDLEQFVYEFASNTKLAYDGSDRIDFTHTIQIKGEDFKLHITNEELRTKVFDPVFERIKDTIIEFIDTAITKPDFIYFSGRFSLSKAFRQVVKNASFARNLIFRSNDDGDWDVVNGAAEFAKNPEIVTERITTRPYFLGANLPINIETDAVVNGKEINGEMYVKGGVLCLNTKNNSVKHDQFFEYNLFASSTSNGAISLELYSDETESNNYTPEMAPRYSRDVNYTYTHFLPLKGLALGENGSFQIRIYSGYSEFIFDAIFPDAVYRLVGLDLVKLESSDEEVRHLSPEEEEKAIESRALEKEALRKRVPAEAPSVGFFAKLFKH